MKDDLQNASLEEILHFFERMKAAAEDLADVDSRDTSAPQRWHRLADESVALVSIIREAQNLRTAEGNSLQALRRLLEGAGAKTKLAGQSTDDFLFGAGRKRLLELFEAEEAGLRNRLSSQAEKILGDPAGADKNLKDKMLLSGLPPELRQAVRQAVIEAARRMTGIGLDESAGDASAVKAAAASTNAAGRGQARIVWVNIRDAARQAGGEWEDLAQTADEVLRELRALPRWVLFVGVAVLVVSVVAGFLWRNTTLRNLQKSNQATQTAVAQMLGTQNAITQQFVQATQTRQAFLGNATLVAQGTHQAGTATAVQASNLTAQAGTQAANATALAATQAANAAAATAQACLVPTLHSIRAGTPEYVPPPVGEASGNPPVYTDDSEVFPSITWVLTNTGQCPWNSLQWDWNTNSTVAIAQIIVEQENSGKFEQIGQYDSYNTGYSIDLSHPIKAGETFRLTVYFDKSTLQKTSGGLHGVKYGVFEISFNGGAYARAEITVEQPKWVRLATPTPPPTATHPPLPTATPKPTSTPRPTPKPTDTPVPAPTTR